MTNCGLSVDASSICYDTGSVSRCHVEGRRGKPGWYRLSTMPIGNSRYLLVGAFGVNSGAEHNGQKILLPSIARKKLTAEQIGAWKAKQENDIRAQEKKRLEEHERAARRSAKWWRECLQTGTSEYLTRKGLPSGNLYGARISRSGNLVIQIQDTKGKTWGLQVVYSDPKIKERKGRDKDFVPAGLAKKGHMAIIGSPVMSLIVLVCEGFATGATLHEATGLPVIVAFDANNLVHAAKEVLKSWPHVSLLFCADDDYLQTCSECKQFTTVVDANCMHCGQPHKKINSGVDQAKLSVLTIATSAIAIPDFPGDRPINRKGPTDFNDLLTHPDGGLPMIARQIEAALTSAGLNAAGLRPIRPERYLPGEGGEGILPPLKTLYSVDEACERWTFLYGGGGAFFDNFDHAIVEKNDVLAMIPDHAYRVWKMRYDRKVARFSEVGFDPIGNDKSVVCNLWGGWPTVPKEGNCEILLELLRWMCSLEKNAESVYQWILRWLAYPIQHPGAKMQTTLLFHGLQGAGKNLFFDTISDIYGDYGRTIGQSEMESQFNPWASRALFLICDEIIARLELYALKNRLKSLITGSTIRINEKTIRSWVERNHCNMVSLSNEQHPSVIEHRDRRHCVIWTPESLPGEFYREVNECLKNGGRQALHHYLLHLDLGDFDEHAKPPMTKAKQDVQKLSAGSVERFIEDWLTGETQHPVCACASGDLYRAYVRWCNLSGEKPRSQNNFSGYIVKLSCWRIDRKDVFENALYSGSIKRIRMVIPPDSLLHTRHADYRKIPDKTEAQWSTDSYYIFNQSLAKE